MAIKVNGTDIILNDRSLEVPNGYVGFGSIGAEALLDVTGMEVGDTIYVDDYEMLATWNGTNWITTDGTEVNYTSTTGGIMVQPGNGYQYHTFIEPGTFTSERALNNLEVLVVGGGGGGGSDGSGAGGGGGGAGGLVYSTSVSISATSYSVTVGAGGAKQNSGGDSSFSSLVAKGGGGAKPYNQNGLPGGSGAGAGARSSFGAATQPGTTQGFPTVHNAGNPGGGGDGNNEAGGGGGAGGVGPNRSGGVGLELLAFRGSLIGVPAIDPLNGYFAGGGGGGTDWPTATPGGLGGGGQGSGVPGPPTGGRADAGIENSGGGGGGGGRNNNNAQPGGSGIVVIRYQIGG